MRGITFINLEKQAKKGYHLSTLKGDGTDSHRFFSKPAIPHPDVT